MKNFDDIAKKELIEKINNAKKGKIKDIFLNGQLEEVGIPKFLSDILIAVLNSSAISHSDSQLLLTTLFEGIPIDVPLDTFLLFTYGTQIQFYSQNIEALQPIIFGVLKALKTA